MKFISKILCLNLILCLICPPSVFGQKNTSKQVIKVLKKMVLAKADSALTLKPITVTAAQCERSAGGIHDFYSEGDYWWQNPDDPNGAYIQRDGQSNPNNFLQHRQAMVRFSQIIGALASAYLMSNDEKYVKQAFIHLNAWFIDPQTKMNPSLLYAQAIKGKATGRAIGVIDMIQMIEVAQGIRVMETAKCVDKTELAAVKNWFAQYLEWVTTHPYGVDERDAKNNHGTCWVMQVAVFAKLTGNPSLIDYCKNRFKTVLLPAQMEKDGSFPLELKRTKPYGYALFNVDAMTTICHVLSDKKESLWDFKLEDGRTLKNAVDFMYPFVENKDKWTFPKDVMYWNEWPVAHPFLLFGTVKYADKNWFQTWKRLEHFPQTEEVIRNLPVRYPVIWL
jgi:hypothetical protein